MAQPRILILDEATSNLDPATETVIEYAMKILLTCRTSIVIAHRPRTALRADRVVVIDNGQIIEAGTPSELKTPGGHFARWIANSLERDPLLQAVYASI